MTNLEKQLVEIIALDRIDIPISSMSGKLKRAKPKLAKALALDRSGIFEGDRAYARLEGHDKLKARGMKEGISKFEDNFPKYGRILKGYIEEQRAIREEHLYFGLNEGCRLTSNDYSDIMVSLGFNQAAAERLYPQLMDISRNLSRKETKREAS